MVIMVDLGPFNEVMKENYLKIILVGALVIAGNLFFRWLEKRLKAKKVKRFRERR